MELMPPGPKRASRLRTDAERKAANVQTTLRCRAKNMEAYKTYQLGYMRKTYSELRDAVIEMLGGKCQHCGYNTDSRALQIDHIDGTGRKERRHVGWYRFFYDILDGKAGYQLLCANCNYIKRYDNNEVHIVDEKLRSRKEIA